MLGMGNLTVGLWCRALADLFFPRCCTVCGNGLYLHEEHVCTVCMAEIPYTYFWTFSPNAAEKVFIGRVDVERVWSLFYYTESYRQLVHSLKYRSNVKIGLWLGEMLGEKIALSLSAGNQHKIDYIIPVPLHWRKQWKRGYNQSEIIAKGVVKGFGECKMEMPEMEVPKILTKVLKRTSFTRTQTHKDRHNRWLNVCNAFAVNEKAAKRHNLAGKHILLIDDVLTTGATLEACASILVEQLGCRVSIATLAYVE